MYKMLGRSVQQPAALVPLLQQQTAHTSGIRSSLSFGFCVIVLFELRLVLAWPVYQRCTYFRMRLSVSFGAVARHTTLCQ